MIRESVDVLVIGAGFAGSLTALLMQRIGRTVALIDSGRHPRFAIGESSTPLADLTLRSLAERYDLPQFAPLCNYGSWKRMHPELVCGQKRGFSYFRHERDMPFQADSGHSSELLVTASRSAETSDTHWLRSDVDHFFALQAAESGIAFHEETEVHATSRHPWRWEGRSGGEPISIEAAFVIDASGAAGIVAQAAGATLQTDGFHTQSWSIYAHVEGLEPWQHVLQRLGVDCTDHPFRADAAAVHHLLQEGWMWQLPFDNGVTSVGLVLDTAESPCDGHVLWRRIIGRHPTIEEQLRDTRIVAPGEQLVTTGRLQRRWTTTAGEDWVLLPGTAGFIDPLHSTGIAHSLSGVERLTHLTEENWGTESFGAMLTSYDRELEQEFELIDHLVAACNATRDQFEIFAAATMLYFVAAIVCEERRLNGDASAFLAVDDDPLRRALLRTARRLIRFRGTSIECRAAMVDEVRTAIAPWNTAGLLQPDVPNMYHYTGR